MLPYGNPPFLLKSWFGLDFRSGGARHLGGCRKTKKERPISRKHVKSAAPILSTGECSPQALCCGCEKLQSISRRRMAVAISSQNPLCSPAHGRRVSSRICDKMKHGSLCCRPADIFLFHFLPIIQFKLSFSVYSLP